LFNDVQLKLVEDIFNDAPPVAFQTTSRKSASVSARISYETFEEHITELFYELHLLNSISRSGFFIFRQQPYQYTGSAER
jgi:hypothetical protein